MQREAKKLPELTIRQQHLVVTWRPYALKLAKGLYQKYGCVRGLGLDDAISAAFYGLIKAAIGYRKDRGAAYCTYASWVIRREVFDAAEGSHVVKCPNPHTLRSPEVRELVVKARALRGLTSGALLLASLRADSLPWGEEGPDAREAQEIIREVLEGSCNRMRALREVYLKGRSRREVAREEGVTGQAISLRCQLGLEAIRRKSREEV